MIRSVVVLALFAAVAVATHVRRLSDREIAALEANYKAMTNKAEDAALAAKSRASLKRSFVEDTMKASTGRKRALVEAEAEEWLDMIQEAKRAVHKSMGIPNIEPRDDGLWQGDIMLRKSEAEDIILENGGKLPAHRKAAAEARRAKRSVVSFDTNPATRWSSPISYTFDSSLSDPATQARIKANLAKITAGLPCLTFNYVANPDPNSYYMNFKNPKGAQSLTPYSCGGSAFIGMMSPNMIDGGTGQVAGNAINIECLMTYSDQCFIDTMIVHEVFHSLGMSHEQCRGDRDAWITIDFTNVISNMANNYAIDSNATFTPYGQQYHYDSVMQYKSTTLALDPSKPVMQAKVAPIDANTAMMGNNAPVCGAIATDWAILNRAYCQNPFPMVAPVQLPYKFFGCFPDATTCNGRAANAAQPSCPSGYTASSGGSGTGCFSCDGNACFNAQAGDNWVATAYRNAITAAGSGSVCGAPNAIMGQSMVTCNSNTPVCADLDIMCGWSAGSCSDVTFAKKCAKTCNTCGKW